MVCQELLLPEKPMSVRAGQTHVAVLMSDRSVRIYSCDLVSGKLSCIKHLKGDTSIVTAISFHNNLLLIADTHPTLCGYELGGNIQ